MNIAHDVEAPTPSEQGWVWDPDTIHVSPTRSWISPDGFDDSARYFIPAGARRYREDEHGEASGNWNYAVVMHNRGYESRRFSRKAPEQTALSVVQRMLRRGMFPPLSRHLTSHMSSSRKLLSERVPVSEHSWRSADGSEAEQLFLSTLIAHIEPRELLFFLSLQVPFAHLVEYAPDDHRRVDFAFLHPMFRAGRSRAGFAALIVEIDGFQHVDDPAQRYEDNRRDQQLRSAGHVVIRIPAADAGNPKSDGFTELRQYLKEVRFPRNWDEEAAAAIHTQAAVLHAIERGILNEMDHQWEIACAGPWSKTMALAVDEFLQTVASVSRLYGASIVPDTVNIVHDDSHVRLGPGAVRVSWTPLPWWYTRKKPSDDKSVFDVEIRPLWLPHLPTLPAPPIEWIQPDPLVRESDLEHLLRVAFPGMDAFRKGQLEAIRRSLSGADSVVLLPTGAGKSLIFQLVSLLLPGTSLVVAPLVALMDDQKFNLRRAGFDRVAAITAKAAVSLREVQSRMQEGVYMIVYLAPERLQRPSFRNALRQLSANSPIPQVVVDEAHCVSEWGHDFRTSYLNVGRVARQLARRGKGSPASIIGLTGTASRAVLRDVQRELGISDLEAVITPDTFDRAELSFEVIETDNTPYKKSEVVKDILTRVVPQRLGMAEQDIFSKRGGDSVAGIVFCPHANGTHGVRKLASYLRKGLRTEIVEYTGKDDEQDRRGAATQFQKNEANLMVATNAFGMGVDKPNIRYTIHYQLPPSLESFYQEAGRAGRDRSNSVNILLKSVGQESRIRQMLDPGVTNDAARAVFHEKHGPQDDVDRNLWFFFESFRGMDADVEVVSEVLRLLDRTDQERTAHLNFDDGKDSDLLEKSAVEKALHRLILLGVVRDYTISFSSPRSSPDSQKLVFSGVIEAVYVWPTDQELRESFRSYVAGYSISRARRLLESIPPSAGPASRERILEYARALVGFIYATVEGARRSAIRTVVRWADQTKPDRQLRAELLAYLQETESSRSVFQIMQGDEFNLDAWTDVVAYVSNAKEAGELKAAVDRALEDFPDHPALLACRTVVSGMTGETVSEMVGYAAAAMGYLYERYSRESANPTDLVRWVIDELRIHRPQAIVPIVDAMLTRATKNQDAEPAYRLMEDEVMEHSVGALSSILDDVTRSIEAVNDWLMGAVVSQKKPNQESLEYE